MSSNPFLKRIFCLFFLLLCSLYSFAQFPRFKALVFYSTDVEEAHVNFANDAINYFEDLTIGNGFVLDTTTNMDKLLLDDLASYSLVIMLNDFPHTKQQRLAFENYMDNGGGWLGFHVSAYNDKTTNWPWFVEFLGGAVFYTNNWPPMPAKIVIEDTEHLVTKGMPDTYIAPANEWYQWKPSPRDNPDIKILASLSDDNYPFGLKDVIQGGDTPVVWTNTNYRMVYMNIGHGSRIFKEAVQNRMVIAALKYVVSTDKKGNVFKN